MKTICLPYTIEKIARILSYIAVALLDVVHFILAPITWLKFKAHAFMFLIAGAGYFYLHFFKHNESALFIVTTMFSIVVLSIVLIKRLRKVLHRVRQSLMKVVYAPVGVYFVLPSSLAYAFDNKNCKKLVKCGSLD